MAGPDFYSLWLGVPTGERPPAAHELLRLDEDCYDPHLIDEAAHKQLERLDRHVLAADPIKRQACQRLMNEVGRAAAFMKARALEPRELAWADEPGDAGELEPPVDSSDPLFALGQAQAEFADTKRRRAMSPLNFWLSIGTAVAILLIAVIVVIVLSADHGDNDAALAPPSQASPAVAPQPTAASAKTESPPAVAPPAGGSPVEVATASPAKPSGPKSVFDFGNDAGNTPPATPGSNTPPPAGPEGAPAKPDLTPPNKITGPITNPAGGHDVTLTAAQIPYPGRSMQFSQAGGRLVITSLNSPEQTLFDLDSGKIIARPQRGNSQPGFLSSRTDLNDTTMIWAEQRRLVFYTIKDSTTDSVDLPIRQPVQRCRIDAQGNVAVGVYGFMTPSRTAPGLPMQPHNDIYLWNAQTKTLSAPITVDRMLVRNAFAGGKLAWRDMSKQPAAICFASVDQPQPSTISSADETPTGDPDTDGVQVVWPIKEGIRIYDIATATTSQLNWPDGRAPQTPRTTSIRVRGQRLAWFADGTIYVYDRPSGATYVTSTKSDKPAGPPTMSIMYSFELSDQYLAWSDGSIHFTKLDPVWTPPAVMMHPEPEAPKPVEDAEKVDPAIRPATEWKTKTIDTSAVSYALDVHYPYIAWRTDSAMLLNVSTGVIKKLPYWANSPPRVNADHLVYISADQVLRSYNLADGSLTVLANEVGATLALTDHWVIWTAVEDKKTSLYACDPNGGPPRKIYDAPGYIRELHTSASFAAWIDQVGVNSDVMLCNLSTGQITKLTNDPAVGGFQCNLSDQVVTWTSIDRKGGSPKNVFAYDIASQQSWRIDDVKNVNGSEGVPSVDGSSILWTGTTPKRDQFSVWLYDTQTRLNRKLDASPGLAQRPNFGAGLMTWRKRQPKENTTSVCVYDGEKLCTLPTPSRIDFATTTDGSIIAWADTGTGPPGATGMPATGGSITFSLVPEEVMQRLLANKMKAQATHRPSN